MGHKRLQLQVQNLPGIWVSDPGMMAWMPGNALGLKKLHMHCKRTHTHAHAELPAVRKKTGGTICSFLKSTSLQRLQTQP